MKVTSLGYDPNLGEEFMQRHGASFVIAQRAPSQPSSASVSSSAPSESELEDSPEVGARRIARFLHQNAQIMGKKPA